MNAAQLIYEAKRQGIELWAEGPALRYRGKLKSLKALLPELKTHKAEVIALLAGKPAGPPPATVFGPPDPEPRDEWQRRVWAGWQFYRGQWFPPGAWKATEPHQGEPA